MNVGPGIASELGWHFMSHLYCDVDVKLTNGTTYKLAVMHPGGGTAYAVSYKPQNIARSMAGGTKPDFLGIGHFHKSEMLPKYRNICLVQAGCFQDQTTKMMEESNDAHVGGWIMEVRKNKTVSGVTGEFISFYE
jgi:hypothetical protein